MNKFVRYLIAVPLTAALGLPLLAFAACSAKAAPGEILGVGIGIERAAVKELLSRIAVLERTEGTRQDVWRLKADDRFNYVAVGYDEKNMVRYVTAFADPSAKNKLRFTEVGDINAAKKEIVDPHYRYTWVIEGRDAQPGYFVSAYGDNPQFVTIYSLGRIAAATDEPEDDD
jgi:hypothetical protein